MTRTCFLTALLLAPLAVLHATEIDAQRTRPNIIVIFTDDHGEKQNILASHPDIAGRLRDHLTAWGADLKPPGVEIASLTLPVSNYFDYYLDGKPAVRTPPSASSDDATVRRKPRKQRRDRQNPK